MSSAVAAARKRRAGPMPPDPSKSIPSQGPSPSPSPSPSGLTLPQVIALVDKRLVILEKFMNDSSRSSKDLSLPLPPSAALYSPSTVEPGSQSQINMIQDIHDVLDDYNSRFILLTEEIANLKDVIIKLQSFTMDVNQKLVEERLGNVEFVLETPEFVKEVTIDTSNNPITYSVEDEKEEEEEEEEVSGENA